MFGTLFALTLLLVALFCGFAVVRLWRSPSSWHLDGETQQVEFHAWLDIAILAVVDTICMGFWLFVTLF